MATLEKIRSKSVLLFVIIIVALLAFILGDFLTSGRTYMGSGMTMAKAGKAKVEYTDYQNRMNAVSEQQRNSQRNADSDELAQEVLQQLLLEKMMKNEYEALGLTVTDKELTEALTGANPHPVALKFIMAMSEQLGIQNPSGQAVYEAMTNPVKYGLPAEAAPQLKEYWASLEQQVEQQMLQDKFENLVKGLFVANPLDAQSLYNDVAVTRHISYASKDINSVADDQVEVTDADRKAAWHQDQANYRLSEPLRVVDYIVVRIEPSQADRTEGQHQVEDAILALQSQEGTANVADNPKFVVNTVSATASQIRNKKLKAFADTAEVGKVVILEQTPDKYTLAKLIGVSTAIDSINVSMLALADQSAPDSLLTLVNEGKSFADLIDGTTVVGQDSTWTTLAVTGIPENIKNAMETNAIGTAFILTDTIQGNPSSTLYRINKRHAPVKLYELASIEYTIDPSLETINNLSEGLHTFVSNNSSADDFKKNAADAGYTVLTAPVMTSSAHVANLSDSRQVVKWIMNAKKGQVMPVFQDNKQTYLLTVAVDEINDGDYLPYTSTLIADAVNAKALKNKKAEKLMSEYAGKATDIDGYAKLMGVDVQSGDAMFNSPMLAGIGYNESALQGAVAAAEQGKVTGPIQGNNAVVVFVVTGDDNTNREFSLEEYSNQFNRSLGIGPRRNLQDQQVFRMLLGKDKIENKSLNFIQGFGE